MLEARQALELDTLQATTQVRLLVFTIRLGGIMAWIWCYTSCINIMYMGCKSRGGSMGPAAKAPCACFVALGYTSPCSTKFVLRESATQLQTGTRSRQLAFEISRWPLNGSSLRFLDSPWLGAHVIWCTGSIPLVRLDIGKKHNA